MNKFLVGVILLLIGVLTYKTCQENKNESISLETETAIIEQQIKNVGKLIVTEANYAQVLTYSNNKELLYGLLDAKKKAIITVNTKATIAYDLSKVKTRLDPKTKTVYIEQIPYPELSISPSIEYYDITQDYFNPFTEKDYNTIKKRVEEKYKKELKSDKLYAQAQNRLLSELQKIYFLTSTLGWTLTYNKTEINNVTDFKL